MGLLSWILGLSDEEEESKKKANQVYDEIEEFLDDMDYEESHR